MALVDHLTAFVIWRACRPMMCCFLLLLFLACGRTCPERTSAVTDLGPQEGQTGFDRAEIEARY